jgi:CheY-like chemotaxis protein
MTVSSKAVTPDSCGDQDVDPTSLTKSLGTRLLIVDDEFAHLKVLAVMVEQAGRTCKTAPSAMVARRLPQRGPLDAIIADLNMPGVSGLELLREIRRHYPNMVFLMATGIEDVRIGVQARKQIADDYLPQVARVFLSISTGTWEAIREQASAVHFNAAFAGLSFEIPASSPHLPDLPRNERSCTKGIIWQFGTSARGPSPTQIEAAMVRVVVTSEKSEKQPLIGAHQ